MIDKLSHKLAVSLHKKQVIEDEEDIELYHYGFFVLISEALFILSCIFVGVLLGMFLQSVIFCATFFVLRRFAGGYHAKTELKCQIVSILIFLISMFLIYISIKYQVYILCIFTQFVCSILLIIFSPADTPQKQLNASEKMKFKKITFVIVNILCVISTILYCVDLPTFFIPISCAILTETIMVILGRLLNHRLAES